MCRLPDMQDLPGALLQPWEEHQQY